MQMLREGEPLTLRGAAHRAGVSHAAPAHHFAGLNGLRTAIATRAISVFAERLAATGLGRDQSPFDKLVEMGGAYCDFATEHVDLFHLMFVTGDVDRADPDLMQASMTAYAELSRVCAPFVPEGQNAWLLEHAVWALTHGSALLQMQNPLRNAAAPVWGPPLESLYRFLLDRSD